MESQGWRIDVCPLFSDRYLKAFYGRQSLVAPAVTGYWGRLQKIFLAKQYDLIWIEKEVFPFLPVHIERFLLNTGIPSIVDYDDALFHRYDRHPSHLIRQLLGKKIDAVMRHSTLVVAGNDYLANRAKVAGAKWVEMIPTVIDLRRYHAFPSSSNRKTVVGWVGSPATSHYLNTISSVIKSFAKNHDITIIALGADQKTVNGLPVKTWPWFEETEVQCIQAFDIGIMPLIDSPWERGKCGYKLIQYMGCGKPVIASPVGVNKDIVEHGVNGFHAASADDWLSALRVLSENPALRKKMGAAGREKVRKKYSLQVTAPELISLLKKAKERK